jgi:hypothetical protein
VNQLKAILVNDHVEILQRVEKLLPSKFDVVEKCSDPKAALEAVDRWGHRRDTESSSATSSARLREV